MVRLYAASLGKSTPNFSIVSRGPLCYNIPMQDEFKDYNWYPDSVPLYEVRWDWTINTTSMSSYFPIHKHLRFIEVVCLGEPDDDLTVSEVICARFSDEEIQLLGLNE